jgi:site-specific recombinase XerD
MPNVRYNLQTPNQAESYVVLVFRYDGQRLVYYPGERVKTAWWNVKAGWLRNVKENPYWREVNAGLDKLAGITLDIYRRYRNTGEALPPELFRRELDAAWKGRTMPAKKEQPELMVFLSELIQERATSGRYATNTLKVYRTLYGKLERFSGETRYKLTWESVTLEFHAKFTGWLSRGGQRANTVHKMLKTLKAVMAEAADRGHHANYVYLSKRFTVKTEPVTTIYLTDAEIEAVAALELEGAMLKARDLFLVGCATGLRFSDYEAVKAENITVEGGMRILNVHMRKVRRDVAIPVLPLLETVLARWGGSAPPSISNQRLNAAIKDIGRLAGIDEAVTITRIKDDLRVHRTVPKYDLITTHTARRSFATNEYDRAERHGYSWRFIMNVLGHRTERQFFAYIKRSPIADAVRFMTEREKRTG